MYINANVGPSGARSKKKGMTPTHGCNIGGGDL